MKQPIHHRIVPRFQKIVSGMIQSRKMRRTKEFRHDDDDRRRILRHQASMEVHNEYIHHIPLPQVYPLWVLFG